MCPLFFEMTVKPGSGDPPTAGDRGRGQAQNLSDLLAVQAAEVAKLHHFCLLWVGRGQIPEGLIDAENFRKMSLGQLGGFIQGQVCRPATPFGAKPIAGMVGKDSPHHPRGSGQKMGAILPLEPLLLDETQVGLMHQCTGIKGMSRPLVVEIVGGYFPKLIIDQSKETIWCLLLTLTPFFEKPGDIARIFHFQSPLKQSFLKWVSCVWLSKDRSPLAKPSFTP